MNLAPILLFTYNRPEHTVRTLQALKQNHLSKETQLYVFSDGAKSENERENVEKVRQLLRNISGFKTVEIIVSQQNKGLAKSIIDGVTEKLETHGKVIVVEDDLITSPYFLTFMNEALTKYENEPKIGHIQGYCYPDLNLGDAFLIKWTGSWGWATWKRAWKYFNPDGQALLDELERKNLTREFDFDGTYKYTRMLRRQIKGENNSWAIRWNASLFLNNMLSLNAGKSLVQNIGFDGTGTHSGSQEIFSTPLYKQKLNIHIHEIKENKQARKAFEKYYRKTNGFWAKVRRRIKRHFNI